MPFVAATMLVSCATGGDAPLATTAADPRSEEVVENTATSTVDEADPTTVDEELGEPAEPTGSTAPPVDEGPPDLSDRRGDMRTRRSRPNQCLDLADGPWAPVGYDRDPLEAVRDGSVPGLPQDGGHLDFERTVEFPTVERYEDISTLRDRDALVQAWREAGYQAGVMRELHQGNYQFAATAVRFRDADGAQAALGAHLRDYCHRSVDARPVPDGNGLTILRDLGAVRTLWVQDDVLLSVFSCVCYADGDRARQDLVEGWAGEVAGVLGTGSPGTDNV